MMGNALLRRFRGLRLPLDKLLALEQQQRDHSEFTSFVARVQGRCSDTLHTELRRHRLLKRHKRWRAAVTIQRFIRGHLVRRRRDVTLLNCKRAEAAYSIYALTQQTERCLFEIGGDLTKTVQLLQRNVRVFLFRRKLYYLGLCYTHLVDSRIEKASAVLRPYIRVYCCKIKLILQQFNTYKKKVLRKVKRRLAVLTIKQVWRGHDLTFQVMRDRLAKRKRRYLARKSKALYKKVMTAKFAGAAIQRRYRARAPEPQQKDSFTTLGTNEESSNHLSEHESSSPKLSQNPSTFRMPAMKQQVTHVEVVNEEAAEPGDAEPGEDPIDDSQLDELADEYDKELFKEMHLRRVAHNIRDLKEIALTPALTPARPPDRCFVLTESRWAKLSEKHMLSSTEQVRNTQVQSPAFVFQKRGLSSDLPLLGVLQSPRTRKPPKATTPTPTTGTERFLSNTESGVRRFKLTQGLRTVQKRRTELMPPPTRRLLRGTISHQMKVVKKYSRVGTLWKPAGSRKEQHLPGLHNSSYLPKARWQTLPPASYTPELPEVASFFNP